MRPERIMIMRYVRQRSKRAALLASAVSAVALLATLELTITPSAWAIAAYEGGDMFANLQTVSDEKLANERGKFMAGGFNLNIGATITTLVNGQLALMSNFNSPDGMTFLPSTPQTGPAANGGSFQVGPGSNGNFNHFSLSNGGGSSNQGSGQTNSNNSPPTGPLTVQGVNLNGPGGGKFQNAVGGNVPNGAAGAGTIITDPSGGTTFAGGVVAPTGALNFILNNANNRSVTQQVQLVVTINNWSNFQQQLITAQTMGHIMSSVQGVLNHGH
jgi:hypothetical protein